MRHKILIFSLFFFTLISKAEANESEPNNNRSTANTLALNGSNSGAISPAGDQDWWKVTTNNDGQLSITLTPVSGKFLWAYLYDNDGTTQLVASNSNSPFTITKDGLATGTYYVQVIAYFNTDTCSYTISNNLVKPTQLNDAEPDSTRALALTLPLNGSTTGHIDYYYNHHRDSADWYKVITNADGLLRLTLTSNNGQYVWAYLYDNNGVTQLNAQNTNGTINISTDGLAAGTYYVRINTYYNDGFAPYTLSDSLFVPSTPNDKEPDSTKAQALTLPLNGSMSGHIDYYYNNHRDSADWYKLTTNGDGLLRLRLTSYNGQYVWAYLYDHNGVTQLNAQNTNGTIDISTDGLAAGTYYVRINTYYNNGFAPYTLSDSLFKPAQANDTEPDSTKALALTLPLNGKVTGHVDYYYNNHRDSVDWYKLTTNADGMIRLQLTSNNGQYVWAYLYDDDGVTQLNAQNTNGTINIYTDGLAAGTYYIRINTYYNNGFAPYTLSDSLFTYTLTADKEPNKYASQAATLPANTATTGHVGFYYKNERDSVDWWKINYTGASGALTLTVNSEPAKIDGSMHYYWVQVYKDTTAPPIFNSNYNASTTTINLSSLAKAYYYIRIFPYYNNQYVSYSITPTFKQTSAGIATLSYDTSGSCSSINTINYKLSKSHSPYTVQLFRFGLKYGSAAVTKTSTIVFDSLPDGKYYATVFGDGATGAAFGRSDTITIMPAPSTTSTAAIDSTKATLNWTIVTCADYDSIQYRMHGTTSWSTVTVPNTGTFILKGLTPSTTYDWHVAAIDSSNKWEAISAFTPVLTFKTTGTGFDISAAGNESDMSAANSKLNNTIMISPNPASSYFTIYYSTTAKDKLIATLYDENGKPVWTSGALSADALKGKQVMVSQFGSGLYYLRITNSPGADVQTAKVSIAR
jgi:hypothetical protein